MINWTITSMESQPTTGIVVSADWLCIGNQGKCNVSLSGTCSFPAPGEQYTPYDQLTQDQVLNWVWIDGGVDKTTTEIAIEIGLKKLIAPDLIEQSLPWEVNGFIAQ